MVSSYHIGEYDSRSSVSESSLKAKEGGQKQSESQSNLYMIRGPGRKSHALGGCSPQSK